MRMKITGKQITTSVRRLLKFRNRVNHVEIKYYEIVCKNTHTHMIHDRAIDSIHNVLFIVIGVRAQTHVRYSPIYFLNCNKHVLNLEEKTVKMYSACARLRVFVYMD